MKQDEITNTIIPVNSFLHNRAMERDYIIVREVYSSSKCAEKMFFVDDVLKGDSVQGMLKRVKMYLNVILQNLELKNKIAKSKGYPICTFDVSVYESIKINGRREEKLLKRFTDRDSVFGLEFLDKA